jgi:Fe-S-cluster containining protein
MRIVPWTQIQSWNCVRCGLCCRHYDIVLKFPEWLQIIKNFGPEFISPNVSKFLLRRKQDGSCVFLRGAANASICSLQHMKPVACKLWPFKILDRPKYGEPEHAIFNYRGHGLFVYVDKNCTGLRFGAPSFDFTHSVIPEFVEIALGLRQNQYKSTSLLGLRLRSL